MTIRSRAAMAELLRLTQSGQLAKATARIQLALSGMAAPATSPSSSAAGDIIDLKPARISLNAREQSPTPATTTSPKGAPPVDHANRFEERTYKGPEGSLAYHLYVPADAGNNMPLVVMLHGCTQSPEDFARGTGMNQLADEMGFIVVYPRQSRSANAQQCWNWFRPGDQQRDRGEPALIAGVTRQVIAEQGADPDRVYVAGLSAGGAAAAIMGQTYPDIYAAIGIHSGLACGSARDLPSALMAMRNGSSGTSAVKGAPFVPVITFHGDRDSTVHEANSRIIVAAASTASGRSLKTRQETGKSIQGTYTRETSVDSEGRIMLEQWTVHGAGHAWSGGHSTGSYTDPSGPDASREMLRFFFTHKLARAKSRVG
ncbi:MAG: PHB depolymerase family esterase [Sphingobium sp.]|uniref:extracellular catalytic domain type 1 short-chain-length polyhydroxyalkanoate depolymerase n=1 Tax=Sphingobium sp. TaxID=1912891 RepID=UPI0029BDC4BC|nr:PHB depolymerase family esterase [Sphingobium sp.]MDX3909239.1 PHB depolymerase family esterase [Sphingobium sp.]